MLGRMYEDEICSAARALEVIGERWSLLILRNAMFGSMTRYSEFQRDLKIAPNVLAKRLADFVDAGIFQLHQEKSNGHAEYQLTEKGLDLKPVILALTEWGDRWAAPDGHPVTYRHRHCGGQVELRSMCTECGKTLTQQDIEADVADWVLERKYGHTVQ